MPNTPLAPADAAQALAALVHSRLAAPFAWGAHDCALFAADAVQAQTGTDPAAGLRGTYATQAGAARVIKKRGGLQAIATAALGAPLPSPLLARAGDVGLVTTHDGTQALAVCHGAYWLAPGPEGLCPVTLRSATVAWRVLP